LPLLFFLPKVKLFTFCSEKKYKPMKIHEYQGKELLKNYGVPVPRGIVARTPEEAEQAARDLGTSVVVVKAQIHAGGRGKGGGVKLAKSPEEARTIAEQMIGMMLVTHQTGAEGREVKTLLIEEGLPIDREFYLAVTLDRVSGRNVFMASSAGGMDIEKVAEETPELILKEQIDPSVGCVLSGAKSGVRVWESRTI
jgi:succinyl-CoA synthetase beta subunit